MEWFMLGARWHAIDASKPETTTFCGAVMVDRPEAVTAPDDDPYPPNACTKCKLEVAFQGVEDESLADALSRGYLPYNPEVDGSPD